MVCHDLQPIVSLYAPRKDQTPRHNTQLVALAFHWAPSCRWSWLSLCQPAMGLVVGADLGGSSFEGVSRLGWLLRKPTGQPPFGGGPKKGTPKKNKSQANHSTHRCSKFDFLLVLRLVQIPGFSGYLQPSTFFPGILSRRPPKKKNRLALEVGRGAEPQKVRFGLFFLVEWRQGPTFVQDWSQSRLAAPPPQQNPGRVAGM